MTDCPSKSRVNKAGKRLRSWTRGDVLAEPDQWQAEIDVVQAHRRAHKHPMTTANVSLRQYCERRGQPAQISQRLKRLNTIVEKLTREPTLQLGNMQDIGGVRVVLPSINDVYALADWLLKHHPDAQVSDYIATPRKSGYRAIHVIAGWATDPRKPVEIQLRSTAMHSWADMVEETSALLGVNYKQDGDAAFNAWAQAASRIIAANELGEPVTTQMVEALHQASATLMIRRTPGKEG